MNADANTQAFISSPSRKSEPTADAIRNRAAVKYRASIVRPALAGCVLGGLLLFAPVHSALAEDRADLEGTQITGSRELPKVLYIVPWKQPLPTDLVGRPAQSLLDEALAPIDREVFRREVEFHAQLQLRPSTADAPAPGNTK